MGLTRHDIRLIVVTIVTDRNAKTIAVIMVIIVVRRILNSTTRKKNKKY
jgi:hypothetical protein